MKAIKHIIDGQRCERELSPEAYKVFTEWNHERKWAPYMNIGAMIEFLGDAGMVQLQRRHNGFPPVERFCDELWELTKETLEIAKENGTLSDYLCHEVPENRQIRYFQDFPVRRCCDASS